ncbi:hypothetical protein F0U59_35850 [Archangium gephyra]|nr:hypothetical protein F0U59_35850 [Archangium gephyra]
MPLGPTRFALRPLLAGLMLSACGGAPGEAGVAPAEEPLGTREAPLDCAGASVNMLTIDGMSLWGGVLSGGGRWSVTYPANGVQLSFYVDGVLRGTQPIQGDANRSGSWNFNDTVACGTHTFEVRASPATFDSSSTAPGVCTTGSTSRSYTVSQPCPTPPSDSLSCTQSSLLHVTCTGTASGGSGSYPTRWWNYQVVSPLGPNFSTGWHPTGSNNPTGSNSWTYQLPCKYTGNGYYDPAGRPPERLTISFKVMDSNNLMSSASRSFTYQCVPGTYF